MNILEKFSYYKNQLFFSSSLEKCKNKSIETFENVSKHQLKVESEINNLKKKLDSNIKNLKNKKDADKFAFIKVIDDIENEIKQIVDTGVVNLKRSLDIKHKHLQDFTISLFGRTKAGKSTLRETLTYDGKSDCLKWIDDLGFKTEKVYLKKGDSIGKGAQRCTQDVFEYKWNGLRLIDTPGIEAFKGAQDTKKANKVIDQSDIVLFLVTNNSVQQEEFEKMLELKNINKHFIVVLNVKMDISKIKDMEFCLKKPTRIFDEEVINGHKKHIELNLKNKLNINNAIIVPIHELSAYYSKKEDYSNYSKKLWDLSRIDLLFNEIVKEINTNGIKRRVETLFEGSILFVDEILIRISDYKNELENQKKILEGKKLELNDIFNKETLENTKRIKSEVKKVFNRLREYIPFFIDNYVIKGNKESNNIIEKEIKQTRENAVDKIDILYKEMRISLENQLKEFTTKFQWDLKNINFSNINSINTPYKSNYGRALQIFGGLGSTIALAALPLFSIPVTIPIALVGIGVGLIFSWIGSYFNKNAKQDLINKARNIEKELISQIDKMESDFAKESVNLMTKQLINQTKDTISPQINEFITSLNILVNELNDSENKLINYIKIMKIDLKKSLENI